MLTYRRAVAGGAGFDEGYRRWRTSVAHRSLLGEGLPVEVEPFSFLPAEGFELVAALLGLEAEQVLVDLGCGRGGTGMWLARRNGARLVGVDVSRVAVDDASRRVRLFPGLGGAGFVVADVAAVGLAGDCADAAVCVDVLQLVDDPAGLLAEARRLLRPGRADGDHHLGGDRLSAEAVPS